jgi:uncharacterized protein YbjT (DUF2867 family)
MRMAITGATGFVGGHLARQLAADGHEIVMIARQMRSAETPAAAVATFFPSDLSDPAVLTEAFANCDAVAHCAGINRELGRQTYQRVHIDGTRNVVLAARQAGVRRIVLMSFLRARPDCGSSYHESKWQAEEIVRQSGIDFTIIRAGVVYGRGDHMLDHLSHALHTFPIFALVGFRERLIRPLAIDDLVIVLEAAVVGRHLSHQTVAVTGPEELTLSEAVKRVGAVIGRRPALVRAPVWFHYLLAHCFELTMKIPLVAVAQVRILSEGIVEPALPCDPLPPELAPTRRFTTAQISSGLPLPGAFGRADLRWCA